MPPDTDPVLRRPSTTVYLRADGPSLIGVDSVVGEVAQSPTAEPPPANSQTTVTCRITFSYSARVFVRMVLTGASAGTLTGINDLKYVL